MAHTGAIIYTTKSDLKGYLPGACRGSNQRVKDWLERKDQK